jgi:hypothetical protein
MPDPVSRLQLAQVEIDKVLATATPPPIRRWSAP